jgi:hypothetical protein
MSKRSAKRSNPPPAPPTRRQVAALPFRVSDSQAVEILVITSRETGRFVIPKGWPMRRRDAAEAAARRPMRKPASSAASAASRSERTPTGSVSRLGLNGSRSKCFRRRCRSSCKNGRKRASARWRGSRQKMRPYWWMSQISANLSARSTHPKGRVEPQPDSPARHRLPSDAPPTKKRGPITDYAIERV